MNINIKVANWQCHRELLKKIREEVFIREQQVSIADEWDEYDETATHFLVLNAQNNALACARVLVKNHLFHIGRVAVLAKFRHQGIGRQLMHFILDWCCRKNPNYGIYLHAQTSRIKFYEYLGFKAQGDVFMDAGIEHVEMWYQGTCP